MKEEEIPDYHVFMMCEKLNMDALTTLNEAYHFRNCKPDELELWKAFPFDAEKVPDEYKDFMDDFVVKTYGRNMDLFFRNTIFVCNHEEKPIATCSYWKSYDKINAIHWLKTLKSYEGKGIGRALLSEIMKQFEADDYPVYLHTQPGSFRAIKLYADFGFKLLRGGKIGTRVNELEKSLPILREFIPEHHFNEIEVINTPSSLIEDLKNETNIEF